MCHHNIICWKILYDIIPWCVCVYIYIYIWLVGWLCLTSHRQRGHLETVPPFTVPCEGCEAR